MATKKPPFSEAKDKASDRKAGVKEDSAADKRKDKAMGEKPAAKTGKRAC